MCRTLFPVLLAAILAACTPVPSAEPATEAAAGASTGVAENTPARVLGGTRPAFAPDYPGSPGEETLATGEPGRRGGVMMFTTTDSSEQVMAFYKARAEAAGLTGPAATLHNGGLTYSVGGPAGDLVVATVPDDPAAPKGGKVGVMVTWSVPEAR